MLKKYKFRLVQIRAYVRIMLAFVTPINITLSKSVIEFDIHLSIRSPIFLYQISDPRLDNVNKLWD